MPTNKRRNPLSRYTDHKLGQKVKQLSDYPSCKGKCKAVLIHAKKAYRGCPGIALLILNFGAVRGEWSSSRHPLYPRERTMVPTEQEARWAPQPVWTFLRTDDSLAHVENGNPDCATHSLVARSSALSTAALVQQVARLRTSISNARGPLDRTQALVTGFSRDFSHCLQAYAWTAGLSETFTAQWQLPVLSTPRPPPGSNITQL
jgi:hypothetical protein